AEFAAEEGAVRFGAGEPPLIAIAGTRPSERAMIAASVEGRAGDIAIRLSSDPPLARQEILALLGAPAGADLGERWNELARSLGELAGAAPQRAGGLAAAAP